MAHGPTFSFASSPTAGGGNVSLTSFDYYLDPGGTVESIASDLTTLAALNPTARQFCVACGARFNIKQKARDRDGRKRAGGPPAANPTSVTPINPAAPGAANLTPLAVVGNANTTAPGTVPGAPGANGAAAATAAAAGGVSASGAASANGVASAANAGSTAAATMITSATAAATGND